MDERHVDALHELLPDNRGVRFAVETVSPPEKSRLDDATEVPLRLQSLAKDFYGKSTELLPKLEQHALDVPASHRLVFCGGNTPGSRAILGGSLFWVVFEAFANHRSLGLTPDSIWSTICYAFQRHVNDGDNAEQLRRKFVEHDGKKELIIEADHLRLGASSVQEWERDIFPQFAEQIKRHVGDSAFEAFSADFSSTTATSSAASQITLMSATRQYFDNSMFTFSGVPSIELSGTLQDWQRLRQKAEGLIPFVLEELAHSWIRPVLLPILDEFVAVYQGQVNVRFWQSMCKRFKHGQGSGSYATVSGWIAGLYPYLSKERQKNMKHWDQMSGGDGPRVENIPTTLSSVPCKWNYFGAEMPLHFHAGVFAASQDESGRVWPVLGWFVSHDIPGTQTARIEALRAQVEWCKATKESQENRIGYLLKYTERELDSLLRK